MFQVPTGTILPAGAFFVPPTVSGNQVTLAATALSGESSGNGTLATLTFEVVAVKASTLTLSDVVLSDGAGVGSHPGVENGQITRPPQGRPVNVPDPNLRAAIEEALGKASGAAITTADMAGLTQLEAPNANISNLTGLEHAHNLVSLSLGGGTVSDLLPLAGLTKLRDLFISDHNISDVSPLSGLTQLRRLILGGTPIADFSPLTRLTQLTTLKLWRSSITDISFLVGLTQLSRLEISGNAISDVSPLTNLTKLTWLQLERNNISDLSPLVSNTGLGGGDEIDVTGNPLHTTSINTHIPTLQGRGVEVQFDPFTPTTLQKISGDNQKGVPGAVLAEPFVVEVSYDDGTPAVGVSITFTVIAGGGTLSATSVETDASGKAESTLTLGIDVDINTVSVSAAGTQQTVTFNAVGESPHFDLSVPAGTSLIHVPLKVTAVDGVPQTITSVADLYDALGGEETVNLLATYDHQTQQWRSYRGPSSRGTAADPVLTDDTGIMAGIKKTVTLRLSGDALGTDGTSSITLHPGTNVVGLPLKARNITRVSDLFTLDGIKDNVTSIIVSDKGKFKIVGRAGADGDILITGGQAFSLPAQQAATVTISGEGWYNTSVMAAAPLAPISGLEAGNTTPILALTGSIVDEGTGVNPVGFRVIVKNLSTGRGITGMIGDEGVDYQCTIVDMEMGRAATIGDSLEISVRSPFPFIGVEPVRYTVTTKDVKQNWIHLPELVVYEIPAETELLANYPNPFNPETWIPYRLAEDAFVTLTIYDRAGQVVRTLDVGHRIAAVYESRSKAIYWDGRNDLGESVASGVYFYHLTAGGYSATKRMVIVK